MTTFGKTVTAGIVAIIIILAIALFAFTTAVTPPSETSTTTPPVTTTTPPASSGTLYQDSDLGFSFQYPAGLSVVPQNFMDTTASKTLVILANADKSSTIRVSVLNDPKTGKPISSDVSNYENALISNTIFDASGAHPKSFSEFSLRQFGDARFAYVKTGLFEGVLGADYYAAVPGGIVRFSLTSKGVDWTNPSYDAEQDPGHLALKAVLATFKVGAASSKTQPDSSYAFADPAGAYSANAPAEWADWKANKNFSYDSIGPDKKLPGVSFAIPAPYEAATNLSNDSYISIEKNPYAKSCIAAEFTSTGMTNPDAVNAMIGGISWNVGKSMDVGAGNYYDERVYAAKSGTDCYGIRLFLHSGNVDNYDAGARQQFDKALLTAIQDKVVASFRFLK